MQIKESQATTAVQALTARINFANEVNKYASSRNVKKLKRIMEDAGDFANEARIKHCFKDKDGCPVKDDKGNFKFKPENEKEFIKEIKARGETLVDFEPYKFRKNEETEALKYLFINSDLEFLLSDDLLAAPAEEEEEKKAE